jgi:glutamine synthetase
VSLLNQGYQYLTEQRYDEMDPILEILRTNVVDLGLPLRSIEVEFGPSQVEFTFRAGTGMESADAMVLFRSAAKQVAQRHGYHATFMCRPKLPRVMSSGWHLHQSLKDRRTHANAFMDAAEPLSPLGMHYMAGLLHHARGAAAFSTPTLNGYKRYRPFSLAPDRALWGRDNRGAMVRVLGGPGDATTHLENRVGEPAANPYLYMASQIVSGLDGVDHKLDPGPSSDLPYHAKAPPLPRSLAESLAALGENKALRAGFGDFFVDYYLKLKQAEIDRFSLEVSDWEQREYFSLF